MDKQDHSGDSRYLNLRLALADGRIFTMSQAGNDDPSYQWSSETNRNLSYSMTVNTKIGVGIADANGVYPSYKTEVAFTRNERVTVAEAQAQLSLIGNETHRAAAAAALAQSGVMVSKVLTDGESVNDYIDPVYQFTDLTNSDKSYSIALKSGIPVGEKNADGSYPSTKTEALWNVSERVARSTVAGFIEDSWFSGDATDAKLIEALVSIMDSDAFYKSYGSSGDNVSYQWTSRTNPNMNYSLAVKDQSNPVTGINWHEATFTKTRRVSRDEV
ncbi:MAG: hypothetical protein HY767_03500, partial [Candidatus Omnitrophica bacterium]|nr:hypothetical protein [Candidatus Omnitrophota bacterium]